MMNNFNKILVAASLALGVVTSAAGQDPEVLLERARLAATLQENDLYGSIRSDQGREETPVALFLRGEDLQFTTDGSKRFHMRLGDEQYDLFRVDADGDTVAFPSSELVKPIAGSDLTYEDLSLRFLYWPQAKLIGSEKVKSHECWKIRVDNPGAKGNYSAVYLWLHKEFGAFMKVEGFDKKGKKLKRFTVEDVMNVGDGIYTVKKVKVSSYRNGRVTGNSYLEFKKPDKSARPSRR